ncbi:unnamed protein product [Mycena citricolor]|uniref:Afadin and alpha-actinin-binding-domain-containing protein n=1 Tax=Mycena citricolor TaxID=2018698 RepID=A0AAD2K7C1_9AGAR|nr:unnamed protein product [Mycena citricolor]CAK5283182.1 unnamed protein product [Mycena citricolor]
MSRTPSRGVHWGIEPPSFDSPSSEASTSFVPTSSLDYINSQLVAHGFAPSPGLALDGISSTNLERTVKCLLGLLSTRVSDMERLEDLTTRLRTLTYDHERLREMHRLAAETAANAEREANLHKSRLTASTRTFQALETTQKQTSGELQRMRTALQAVRSAHQAELKKKDKDVERMAERWNKLADIQSKVAGSSSGLRCSNLIVVENGSVSERGRGSGVVETALQQSEETRRILGEENAKLRGLLLGAVNQAQTMLHQARVSEEPEAEPTPFTAQTLFPMASPDAATDKLSALLGGLREAVMRPFTSAPIIASSTNSTGTSSETEAARLTAVIDGLRTELDRSRKSQVTETQAAFDRFAADHRVRDYDVRDVSMELMIEPVRDAEKERLDKLRLDLERERRTFTDATIKFGRERAELEAERKQFLDEKRSWEVDKMLLELPPTPKAEASVERPVPRRSPRRPKSPRKNVGAKPVTVGKAGAQRKSTRGSKRSSQLSPTKDRVEPAFETEVVLSPSVMTASSSLLPTSFVLPPPSPAALLPAPGSAFPARIAPLPTFSLPPPPEASPLPPAEIPETPFKAPFPMAKPFARGMVHAYSPVKPSPLSRILMLGNSPASDEGEPSMPLSVLAEEDGDQEMFPVIPAEPPARELTLAEELGVTESPPESPVSLPTIAPRRKIPAKAPPRFTAADKGKGRAVEPPPAAKEKENGLGVKRKIGAGAGAAGRVESTAKKARTETKPVSTVSRARVKAKILPSPTKPVPKAASAESSRPRRVLVDNARPSRRS